MSAEQATVNSNEPTVVPDIIPEDEKKPIVISEPKLSFWEKITGKSASHAPVIKDPAEPNILIHHRLYIFLAIGWNWIFIFFAAIGAAGLGVIPLMFQNLFSELLDSFARDTTAQQQVVLNRTALNLLFVAIGSGVASALHNCCVEIAFENVGVRLKSVYFDAVAKQEIGFYDIKQSGALASNLNENVLTIQEGVKALAKIWEFVVQSIAGIIMALTSSWKMTLVTIAGSPALAIVGLGSAGIISFVTTRINNKNSAAFSIATEVLGAMRTVKSMGGEEKEIQRYKKSMNSIGWLGIFKGLTFGLGFGLIFFCIWAIVCLGFWYGGTLVINKEITLGDMSKVFSMVLFSVIGAAQGLAQVPNIAKGIGASTAILKVYLRKPQIPFKGGEKVENVKGNIVFDQVSFTYPSRPEQKVLKSFSMNMKAGQTYALVGASGSGKSTIIALLEKFYLPESGTITIDGVDMAKIDPIYLHKHMISIVTQEPVLFNDTIRNNILYAVSDKKDSITQEMIEKAAKIAYCHDFIMNLPKGYNTVVGERGASLSGGQKQRIAIARAVLQDPKILLLDEATSALDTESEKIVQAALKNLMQNRTSVVVAHRLSTIQDADLIIVMKFGEIVETGKHQDLISKPKGLYRKLAKKQMLVSHAKEDNDKNNLLAHTPPANEPSALAVDNVAADNVKVDLPRAQDNTSGEEESKQ